MPQLQVVPRYVRNGLVPAQLHRRISDALRTRLPRRFQRREAWRTDDAGVQVGRLGGILAGRRGRRYRTWVHRSRIRIPNRAVLRGRHRQAEARRDAEVRV